MTVRQSGSYGVSRSSEYIKEQGAETDLGAFHDGFESPMLDFHFFPLERTPRAVHMEDGKLDVDGFELGV